MVTLIIQNFMYPFTLLPSLICSSFGKHQLQLQNSKLPIIIPSLKLHRLLKNIKCYCVLTQKHHKKQMPLHVTHIKYSRMPAIKYIQLEKLIASHLSSTDRYQLTNNKIIGIKRRYGIAGE